MVVVKPAALIIICVAAASEFKLSTILATLSLMSLAALSKSMLVSNSTLIVLLPFSDLESISVSYTHLTLPTILLV